MATVPLMAHTVSISSLVISVTINGAPGLITINPAPASPTLWGWGVDPLTGEADADTAVRALADALAAAGFGGLPPGPYVAEYVAAASPTRPLWRITIPGGPHTIAFASDVPELGILAGDVFAIPVLSGYMTSLRRWRGIWSPASLGVRCEPVYVDDGATTVSPYNPAIADRVRIARRRLWLGSWPYVEAADVTRDVNLIDPAYLTLADRAADDTLGTLDDLLGAAGSGGLLRLVLDAVGEERDVWLDAADVIQRDAYTTEETVGGRRYRVALPMLEAAINADVTT